MKVIPGRVASRFSRERQSAHRGKLIRRSIAIIQAISVLSLATVESIRDYLDQETIFSVCKRTVYRDVYSLVDAGLIVRANDETRRKAVYKINQMGPQLPRRVYQPLPDAIEEANRRFLEVETDSV